MPFRFLARAPWVMGGAGLAAATVLVTPWSAAAATTSSIHPTTAPHKPSTASARAVTNVNGCDFDQTATTWTLVANCTATAPIDIPNGVTLNGASHTIAVTGAFVGAVIQNAGSSMSVQNLDITGSSLDYSCADIMGILFQDASGSISNVHIDGMTRHNGCQTGFGIRVNSTGTPRTVTITGARVTDFQKAGLVVNGPVTANVTNSTFGPPDFLAGEIAQNTVQYSRGAGGSFTGNTVIGATSGREDAESTGIILYQADHIAVSGNTVKGAGTDIGIAVFDTTNATIERNTIIHEPPPDGVTPGFPSQGVFVDENSADVTLSGNTFDGDWDEETVNADQEPYIVNTSLKPGTVGTPYKEQLEAIAENAVAWKVIKGSLPLGLSLGSDGAITGTPTRPGSYLFTVQVQDGPDGTTSTREFTIEIHPAKVSLHVTKTAFPDPAVAGQPLTFTIHLANGGPDNALGAKVEDGLPASLSGFTWKCYSSGPPTRCSAASGTGSIRDVPVDVAANGAVTFTLHGFLPAHVAGPITNVAVVTPPPGSPGGTESEAGVTVPVKPGLPLTGPDLMPEVGGGVGLIALGGLIALPTWRRRKRPGPVFRSRAS